MIARRSGLVVEVTDGDEVTNALFPDGYRGTEVRQVAEDEEIVPQDWFGE